MIVRKNIVKNRALAARVKRYHTWPVLHQETVGEHTFRVLFIYREIFELYDTDVIEYIMDHDMPEIAVGDLPFPIKKNNPVLKDEMDRIEAEHAEAMGLPQHNISHQDKLRVKVCDLLQMWEFGKIEHRMGNMFAMAIIGDTAQAALSITQRADFTREDHDKVVKWMQENEL